MKNHYDVIVVGAGIAGLTAAIYLKRSNVNVVVIEKEVPGGLLNKISKVDNYPGVNNTTGPELADQLMQQITNLNIEIRYDDVVEITITDQIKTLKTTSDTFQAKAIIVASGRIPRQLNKNGESHLYGKGLSFCSVCDGPLYKNEDVAIVGGGNSALEEALYLSEICSKVTIIHRNISFKGEKGLIDKVLNKKNIEVLYNSQVDEFVESNHILESINVKSNETIINLKVKACFVFIGYEPNTKFLNNLSITDELGYIIVDNSMCTKLAGVYAAGDVVKKDLFQLVTAASDGARAAISCIKYLG